MRRQTLLAEVMRREGLLNNCQLRTGRVVTGYESCNTEAGNERTPLLISWWEVRDTTQLTVSMDIQVKTLRNWRVTVQSGNEPVV